MDNPEEDPRERLKRWLSMNLSLLGVPAQHQDEPLWDLFEREHLAQSKRGRKQEGKEAGLPEGFILNLVTEANRRDAIAAGGSLKSGLSEGGLQQQRRNIAATWASLFVAVSISSYRDVYNICERTGGYCKYQM